MTHPTCSSMGAKRAADELRALARAMRRQAKKREAMVTPTTGGLVTVENIASFRNAILSEAYGEAADILYHRARVLSAR